MREICGNCKYKKEIFLNRKIKVMQNFVAVMKKAKNMEYQYFLTILAIVLKKRSDKE